MEFSRNRLSSSAGFGFYVSYNNGSPSVTDPEGIAAPGFTLALVFIKWVIRLDIPMKRAK